MAADSGLSDAITQVRAHLEADAAVTKAALSEPSDDAYLALKARAQEFYAQGSQLGPIAGRFAQPGGNANSTMLDSGDIAVAQLFALARVPDGLLAIVGSMRDAAGAIVAEALLFRDSDGGWRITGRAAREHLAPGLEFVSTGGEPVPFASASDAQLLTRPASTKDASTLEEWINDHT